jgi:hypothetical protein
VAPVEEVLPQEPAAEVVEAVEAVAEEVTVVE